MAAPGNPPPRKQIKSRVVYRSTRIQSLTVVDCVVLQCIPCCDLKIESSRFPELGTTRLGQYKDQANTAGRCLRDIALETSLILTTGRGKGDNGQPTFFGYNPPFYPPRTEHLLMSTAFFFCCKQISVLHEFDSADHRPLLCRFSCQCSLPHIDLRLSGQRL